MPKGKAIINQLGMLNNDKMKKSERWAPLSIINFILLNDWLNQITPKRTHVETKTYISEIINQYPSQSFDFHGHNDYDLAVANAMEAVKCGVNGLHLTINGMGERAGNAPLASVVSVIKDFIPNVKTNINEKALYKVGQIVSTFTGIRLSLIHISEPTRPY